jgi:predicted anti-sigma-YlaC factor YlaD
MTTNNKTMSCEIFQSQLSDLVGSGADVHNHPHIQECEICRELYEQLQTIAEAARQLFPDQEPEDKLWERIESAIKDEDGISNQD